jgi:hypothetical protein
LLRVSRWSKSGVNCRVFNALDTSLVEDPRQQLAEAGFKRAKVNSYATEKIGALSESDKQELAALEELAAEAQKHRLG